MPHLCVFQSISKPLRFVLRIVYLGLLPGYNQVEKQEQIVKYG